MRVWMFSLVCLAGCPKSTPQPAPANDTVQIEPTPTSAPEPEGPPPGTAGRMYRHWDLATHALTSVISGDAERARDYAASLEALERLEDMPEDWVPLDDQMRQAAHAVTETTDLGGAAMAVAKLGSACANCHGATGRGPKVEPLPEQKWGEEDHMVRHHWAAHWMWLGVIAPSSEAWKTGTSAIVGTKLFHGSEEDAMEQKIHSLAASAGENPDVGLLGEFLTTCGTCHTQNGVKPGFEGEGNPLEED